MLRATCLVVCRLVPLSTLCTSRPALSCPAGASRQCDVIASFVQRAVASGDLAPLTHPDQAHPTQLLLSAVSACISGFLQVFADLPDIETALHTLGRRIFAPLVRYLGWDKHPGEVGSCSPLDAASLSPVPQKARA